MKAIFTLLFLLMTGVMFAAGKPFAAPTQAPTNFTASSNEGDRINVNWSNGNGTKRIVIARKGGPVTFVPVNGVNYGASGVFGSGNEVATGEFVVFNNNQSAVTVSGLQPSTQYYFAIFEYNGTGTDIAYLVADVKTNGTTIGAPTAQPLAIVSSNVIGNSLKISWTNPSSASGGGTGRIVLAREGAPVNVNPVNLSNYTANSAFGLGSQIGTGNYVVSESNASSITVTSLKPGTTYHFAIFEYNGSNGLVYNITAPATAAVTTLPRPTVSSASPSFVSVEGNSMKFSFTKGNGARRIVVMKAGSAVSNTPVDGQDYTANSVFGTAGTELAPSWGEYVVADGIVTDVTVTGLTKATTYHFAVFEYDGTGSGTAYFAAGPLRASQATLSAPTTQASSVSVTTIQNNSATVSWVNGNGSKRIVVMRKDAAVNAVPADYMQYGASNFFGSGSQLGSGNYVVFNSATGNSVNVTNLVAGATYFFSVFECNGSSAPVYLTSGSPTGQLTTIQSPTQAANTFQWSSLEGSRLTFSYTGGNGSNRILVVKAGSPVSGAPVNGTVYNASTNFGSGDQLAAGEYVMAAGNHSQTTLLNLQPGTTYYAAVFEYNIINGQPAYLATPGISSQATVSAPTVQATALQFSNITGNSMKVSWAAGNGAKRLVVVRAGAPVSFVPTNLSYYSPNPVLGSSADLGNGQFAVYSDNSNNVTLLNLVNGVTYHVAVFEYNGISYPVYLSTSPLTGSSQTLERPSVPTANMGVSGLEGNRMTAQWSRGNGNWRLVVASASGPVTALPQDGREYTANTVFGNGTALASGQFVVQAGNEVDVTVTGLQPATTYYFASFEYDGTGSNTRYLTTSYGSTSGTTLAAPANGPANVLFASIGTTTASINWTEATGASRHLVVLRKGAPATALPQQLTPYQSSASYGHSATVMAPEHYVVFNGSGSAVSVTNLQSGTTYYVSVFSFNGNLGPVYNTAVAATSSFTTLGPPTTAASNVFAVSAGNGLSATIGWANGSGQKRLVVVRAGSPVNVTPTDNSLYTANTFFGSGQDLGGGAYAVYSGSADRVTVSNLQRDKVYYVAVFEYNQFTNGPVYLATPYAQGQFSGSILPVKLKSFNGVAKESANILQWTTSQETGAAEFVVERSTDGNNFQPIGKIAAAGNSNVERAYNFEDRNRSAVNFYRLRMVDANGRAEYSAVVRLQTGKEEGMKVFPTLATNTIQISLKAGERSPALISIFNAGGSLLAKETRMTEAGNFTTTIDVSGLRPGHYFVRLDLNGKTYTERFVKQ